MGISGYSSIVLVSAWLFGLTLLITALGFWRLTYFVSVGYAFSMVGMALVVVFVFRQHASVMSLLHNLLLVLWGVRLGVFLFQRERQSSFQRTAGTVHEQYAGVSLPRKLAIWLGVSVLYVLMFLPGGWSALKNGVMAICLRIKNMCKRCQCFFPSYPFIHCKISGFI